MKSYFLAASAAVVAVSAAILIDTSAQAQASGPYLGELLTVPYNYCPAGWLPTEGQTMPIRQYTPLFSLLGTTYGGDVKSTFLLPNMKPTRTESGATVMHCIAIVGVWPPRT
jgi:microcystin-dependent protein